MLNRQSYAAATSLQLVTNLVKVNHIWMQLFLTVQAVLSRAVCNIDVAFHHTSANAEGQKPNFSRSSYMYFANVN